MGRETDTAEVPAKQSLQDMRKGGRELYRNKAAKLHTVGRKNSPQRLQRLLKEMENLPVAANAIGICGISRTALRYWLAKSEAGKEGDGYDVEWKGEINRFHIHWADAKKNGFEKVEAAAFKRATGYLKPQVHQGKVQYQMDHELVALGFTGYDAMLKDADGKPIPESVLEQSEDLQMFLLKANKPEVYGNKQSIDVTHKGGVLVVGVRKTTEEFENEYGGKQPVLDVPFEVINEDAESENGPAD